MNRRRLAWAAAALGATPVGLVAAAWLWGLAQPAGHVVEVSRTVDAPPAAVWTVVTDFERHPTWRTGVERVRREGDRIVETDAWGDEIAYRIELEEPPRRLVTRVVDQTAFSGTWTLTLAPDGAGTRATIVERGEIHAPLFRALAPLFHDPEATARAWLDDLARRWE